MAFRAIDNANHIALEVRSIPIAYPIAFHHCGTAVRTIKEVQMVAAQGQLYYIFAMKYIGRYRSADILNGTAFSPGAEAWY